MPTQKLLERKALIVGIVINVLQVLAGMAVFFMTGLKAMFLDFSFTAISVLSGMVAVYLSSRTVRTTERFPNGMLALEPIYADLQGHFHHVVVGVFADRRVPSSVRLLRVRVRRTH